MKNYTLDIRPMTPHFPGIGRYIYNLVQHLPPLLAPDEQLSLIATIDQDTADISPDIQIKRVGCSSFSLSQQWQIPQALKQLQSDLYHSPYYVMPYTVSLPTVTTMYDLIPLIYPEYSSSKAQILFKGCTRLAVQRSQKIISISEATSADLHTYFQVDPAKIETIPLASDPRFTPPDSADIDTVRTQYNLPEMYFLYLGSNKPHKNLGRLADAYARIAPENCPLLFAGPWDDRFDTVSARHAPLIEAGKIRFLGRVEEDAMPALYAGATAFTFVSEYEGFGLPPLEAMACGSAVIASNQSSLPEVIGQGGLLVNPTSIDEIEHAMRRLLTEIEFRTTMKEQAIQQAKKFSWKKCAEQTLDVYRSMG